MSHCWTCNAEHDPDDACRRPAPAASDLFDDAEEAPAVGPAFTASFDGEDSCCGAGITAGETIRADGSGGWIHDDCKES